MRSVCGTPKTLSIALSLSHWAATPLPQSQSQGKTTSTHRPTRRLISQSLSPSSVFRAERNTDGISPSLTLSLVPTLEIKETAPSLSLPLFNGREGESDLVCLMLARFVVLPVVTLTHTTYYYYTTCNTKAVYTAECAEKEKEPMAFSRKYSAFYSADPRPFIGIVCVRARYIFPP